MFCNSTKKNRSFFHFFFSASCVTWRRHEPAYRLSSKEPTLVLGSWSGTASCCMRCILHSASFVFKYVHRFSPAEESNSPTARPSRCHWKQHFLLYFSYISILSTLILCQQYVQEKPKKKENKRINRFQSFMQVTFTMVTKMMMMIFSLSPFFEVYKINLCTALVVL